MEINEDKECVCGGGREEQPNPQIKTNEASPVPLHFPIQFFLRGCDADSGLLSLPQAPAVIMPLPEPLHG